MIPQLDQIDGDYITPTDRIRCSQNFPEMQEELYIKVEENIKQKYENPVDIYDEELFTPQTRISMAKDVSDRNLEKEKRDQEMWGTGPKEPRDLPGV